MDLISSLDIRLGLTATTHHTNEPIETGQPFQSDVVVGENVGHSSLCVGVQANGEMGVGSCGQAVGVIN